MKLVLNNKIISFTLCIPFLMLGLNSAQADDWTCTEVASIKQENSVLACGVATAATEGEAREKALIRAKREFELICETSAECAGRQTIVEPMRNTCEELANGRYKCFRGLRYTVLDKARANQEPRVPPVTPPPATATTPPPIAQPTPQPRSQSVRRAVAPDESRRSFAVGVSTYGLDVTLKNDDFDEELENEFSGQALSLQFAFTKNFAVKGLMYSMEFDGDADVDVSGTDLRLLWGTNLNRTGFKFTLGLGYYSETWEFPAGGDEDFSGVLVALGAGYNFDRLSIDLEITGRETSDYSDFFGVDDIDSIDVTATTVSIGAAFRF